MSTPQRTGVCRLSVDPQLGAVLRRQTLVVLEVNHHHFEEILDYGPQAQRAVATIYRDAFAVLDALGWAPDNDPATVEVPLTAGHALQLGRCRRDLAHANLDRLVLRDRQTDPDALTALDADIDADRHAAHALDRLLATYQTAVDV